jgi:hypothetical protein
MGFTQRPPTSGGVSPVASPNLPIADSSQAHDIPTGVAPSLAKLQDWIAWLLANGVIFADPVGSPGVITGPITIDGNLSVTGSASTGTDLTVGDDLIVTDDALIGDDLTVSGDASVSGTLDVLTGANVTGPVNVTGAIDASGTIDGSSFIASGTQPASSADPGANTLHATNMVKAWAAVQFNAGTVTVLDGYSIASVATSLGTVGVVTMARAMANANYAVVYSVGGTDHSRKYATTQATGKTTTVFQFNVWDELAAGAVDLSDPATNLVVSICVIGRQ